MKPIFIVGVPRSGNTLFRMILTSHSKICIPPESAFLQYIWPIYVSKNDNVTNDILNKLFSDHKFINWNLSKSEVKSYIEKSLDKNYPEFISGIYNLYLKKNHKEHSQWGDKNPIYIALVERILELFPNAWIILLVREPLSIYGSLKRVNFFGRDMKIAINDFFRRIKSVADAIIEYQSNPNVVFVNYSAFVKDPEMNTRTLISKLGYEFEPEMLNFHDNQSFINEMLQSKVKFHENLFKPISGSFIRPDNYGLDETEIDLIEQKLKHELQTIRTFIDNYPAL